MLSVEKNNVINRPSIIRRRANTTDINALIKITKVNFEDRPLFQFSSFSKKYWNIALESNSTEIWVWEIEGDIGAVALIITDLKTWNIEKLRWGNYNVFFRYLAFLLIPKALFVKIKKKIWLKHNLTRLVDMNKSDFINKVSGAKTLYRYGGIYIDLKRTLWNELVAVSPHFRRYGLAIQIAKFNEERAEALQRSEIYGEIEANNEKWWMLHERLGWKMVHEESGRFTCRKIL